MQGVSVPSAGDKKEKEEMNFLYFLKKKQDSRVAWPKGRPLRGKSCLSLLDSNI
jgi:hypothetical protein